MKGDKIFSAVNYSILTFFLIITLYPIVFVVSGSLSDPKAIMAGRVWLFPVDFTLEGYKVVLNYSRVWSGFANSIFYALLGTTINIVLTVMAAYPLSRRDFTGRNAISFIFAFTMWFSGGMIPTYLLVKDLHLIDTRWAMIIPNAMGIWYVFVTKTYFQTNIPIELFESAKLDGCNDIKYLLKVIVPLSGPIIAVISLFYAVGHWNAFFNALLYLNRQELFPIQLVLREILIMNTAQSMIGNLEAQSARELMSELLKNAMIVIVSLPVIAIYPFAQKYFVKGMMIGAIKG